MISLNDHVTPGNPIINSSANQTIYPRSAPSYFLDINSHDKLCGMAYFWILCRTLIYFCFQVWKKKQEAMTICLRTFSWLGNHPEGSTQIWQAFALFKILNVIKKVPKVFVRNVESFPISWIDNIISFES